MSWCAQAMEQAKAELTEERSEADQAFCSMILRQDNPARGLEDKWADLVSHMHSTDTEQFRCGLQAFPPSCLALCSRFLHAATKEARQSLHSVEWQSSSNAKLFPGVSKPTYYKDLESALNFNLLSHLVDTSLK